MNVSVIFSMLRRAFLIQIPSSRRKPGPSWCSKHLDSGVRRNDDEGVFQLFAIPKAFMQSPCAACTQRILAGIFSIQLRAFRRECEQGSGQHIFKPLYAHREKSSIALTFQHPGGNRFFPLFTLERLAASAPSSVGKPAPLLRVIV